MQDAIHLLAIEFVGVLYDDGVRAIVLCSLEGFPGGNVAAGEVRAVNIM